MLKEIRVTVKRVICEEYTINSDNGFNMPNGTKETLEFVEAVRHEAISGEYTEVNRDEESTIHEIKFIDWN